MHATKSKLAGKDVLVTLRCRVTDHRQLTTVRVHVVDWWDRVSGKSWKEMTGNPTALNYVSRIHPSIPADHEVLLVQYKGHNYLVHRSEVVRS